MKMRTKAYPDGGQRPRHPFKKGELSLTMILKVWLSYGVENYHGWKFPFPKGVTRVLPLVGVCLLACTTANAENRHEFSPYIGGGISSLKYETKAGNQMDGFDILGGFGYSHFFTRMFGLGTGVEMGFYNSRFELNDGFLVESPATKDLYGNSFLFRSRISDYEEKHSCLMLQVPLMLRFQFGSDKRKFYMDLGGKGAIPLLSKTRGSSANLQNSGFYERQNEEYVIQEEMGFGAQNAKGFDGRSVDFNKTGFASVELGIKHKLRDGLALYTGLYFDYGLRAMQTQSKGAKMVEYNTNSPEDFAMNSVLNSSVKEVTPMAAGLKIGLAFGRGGFASTASTEIVAPE